MPLNALFSSSVSGENEVNRLSSDNFKLVTWLSDFN